MRAVITLLVPDRIGILNGITGTVTDLGANIESISQTVVAGYFTVTLVGLFPDAIGMSDVNSHLQERFGGPNSVIGVVPHSPPATVAPGPRERYVVTLIGPEQHGILKTVTGFLAARSINIDDWYLILEFPNVTHVGEISVPSSLDFGHLQNELAETMRAMGLTARIQHENIFRATNEVGPIKALLTEGRHA